MAIDPQPPGPQAPGPQGPYDHGPYGQGPYDQGPYGQGSYDQGPYGQGSYGQVSHGQGSWHPNPYGHYPPPVYVVPTSGMAVASLVCSLVGLVTAGFTAIPGVILGHLALPETRSGQRGGHGLAVAGLIIGWIQCGLWLLFWLFFLGAVGVAGAGAAGSGL